MLIGGYGYPQRKVIVAQPKKEQADSTQNNQPKPVIIERDKNGKGLPINKR